MLHGGAGPSRPGRENNLPHFMKTLRFQARKRGTRLLFLQPGMERRTQNTTYYHRGKDQLYWRVEWRFKEWRASSPAAGKPNGARLGESTVGFERCLTRPPPPHTHTHTHTHTHGQKLMQGRGYPGSVGGVAVSLCDDEGQRAQLPQAQGLREGGARWHCCLPSPSQAEARPRRGIRARSAQVLGGQLARKDRRGVPCPRWAEETDPDTWCADALRARNGHRSPEHGTQLREVTVMGMF